MAEAKRSQEVWTTPHMRTAPGVCVTHTPGAVREGNPSPTRTRRPGPASIPGLLRFRAYFLSLPPLSLSLSPPAPMDS